MPIIVYLLGYLSIIILLTTMLFKVIGYKKNPLHLRWEIYPIPHDAKRASYGGSYLEDVDWWEKERKHSLLGTIKEMALEILFLKGVWEHNRSFWFVTYPFHLGLYLVMGFFGLLILNALVAMAGISVDTSSPFGSIIIALTNLFGPVGFILCVVGALGLFFRRITDRGLNNYSSFSHFFNLGIFILTMAVAILTWLFVDPNFEMTKQFVKNFMTFNFNATGGGLFTLQLILAFFLIAYIPLTHMSHFFMKYFFYHEIRWQDEPNLDNEKTDKQIGTYLSYPVTWSAPHIAGHGKSNWGEVAMFNPAAEQEKK